MDEILTRIEFRINCPDCGAVISEESCDSIPLRSNPHATKISLVCESCGTTGEVTVHAVLMTKDVNWD